MKMNYRKIGMNSYDRESGNEKIRKTALKRLEKEQ
jgi:hypothetical protein